VAGRLILLKNFQRRP